MHSGHDQEIINLMVKCGFVSLAKSNKPTRFKRLWRYYNKLKCWLSKEHEAKVSAFLQQVYITPYKKKPGYLTKKKNKKHPHNIK